VAALDDRIGSKGGRNQVTEFVSRRLAAYALLLAGLSVSRD
jgi:hypothetical protein